MINKKYQIFISSTYEDLIEEREKAIETILSLEQIPIGMEMFNAGDQSQWELIKKTIDTSDYYIIIIGFRYGSIANNGISYTEKEYDYAVKKGIPILTFIKDRNVPSTPNQRENDNVSTEKLNKFINKAEKKIVKFWKNIDELATLISTSLQNEMKRNPRVGWIRADTDNEIINNPTNQISKNNPCKPKFDFKLKNEDNLNFSLKTPKDKNRVELSENDIPKELKKFITSTHIETYNNNLPSPDKYKKYNEKNSKYQTIMLNYHKVNFSIENTGNIKSNHIIVNLYFPEELTIYNCNEMCNLSPPKGLQEPINPITNFKMNQKMDSGFITPIYGHPFDSNKTKSFQQCDIEIIDKNTLQLKIESLLHTQSYTSDDFYVVPLQKGEFTIKCTIICEEISEPIEKYFHIFVN